MSLPSLFRTVAWIVGSLAFAGRMNAQTVIYSADFESGVPREFSYGGTLTGLATTSLPTDGAGMASANQSLWLGKIGAGVGKAGGDELVTLSLTGLTPGTTYHVAFDLLIGASWDGGASGYGPDEWRLRANGNILVDTVFSDSNGLGNLGAYSPQIYSDTTYTNPNGPAQAYFAGADFHSVSGTTDYSNDYAIYYFGHGAGNPQLTFVASSSTASLEFARLATVSGDSSDEYWALDNVQITAVPEPASYAVLVGLVGLGGASLNRWRRRRG